MAAEYARFHKDKGDPVDDIIKAIELNWMRVYEVIEPEIASVAEQSAKEVLVELGFKQDDLFDEVNASAKDFARTRAAQLVGMRWEDGELVVNPNPEWAITETTRDEIRTMVTNAFEEGLTPQKLKQRILDSETFSAKRAEMIARTEMANAQVQGALDGMRATGLHIQKKSVLSADHDHDDECNDAADDGLIELDDEFSIGEVGPPYHPNCWCALVFEVVKEKKEAA